jgi:hypothetical protein
MLKGSLRFAGGPTHSQDMTNYELYDLAYRGVT